MFGHNLLNLYFWRTGVCKGSAMVRWIGHWQVSMDCR